MNWKILTIIGVLIIAGALWYLKNAEKLNPVVTLPKPLIPLSAHAGSIERSETSFETPMPPVAVEMPSDLHDSDETVKSAVENFSPPLLQWLTPSYQIQKWVMLIDQMADGSVPKEYLPLRYPMTSFKASKADDKLMLDTENYERANHLIAVISSIPPERISSYYHAWYPLLNKAYRDLGRQNSFDARLRAAIDRVLANKPLPAQVVLVRPGVFYQYAEPKLENATALDKLMWRLGPENIEKLQAFLRQLKSAL